MKRLLILAAGSGLGLGVLICFLGWWQWTRPMATPPTDEGRGSQGTVLLRVQPGMTLAAAADSLVERRLLAHRSVLLLGARLTGQERGLRVGLYELSHGLSPRDLLEDLISGLSVQVRVTIPEGLGAGKVAEILAETLEFSGSEFLAAADSLVRGEMVRGRLLWESDGELKDPTGDPRFSRLDSLLDLANSGGSQQVHWCEGYLAPDTYLFAEGTSVEFVAWHLVEEQLRRLREAARTQSRGGRVLSPHQLLTLASLVEAEARLEEERTLVAAVYANRLVRNWRLEADPTVAFVLGKKGLRLYFKDLKVESPYNTYRVSGLPPGPIASPGNLSLLAAARPDSTCNAMYFVSDGVGGHVFSRTIQEHEEAVRRFRKIRAASGRR